MLLVELNKVLSNRVPQMDRVFLLYLLKSLDLFVPINIIDKLCFFSEEILLFPLLGINLSFASLFFYLLRGLLQVKVFFFEIIIVKSFRVVIDVRHQMMSVCSELSLNHINLSERVPLIINARQTELSIERIASNCTILLLHFSYLFLDHILEFLRFGILFIKILLIQGINETLCLLCGLNFRELLDFFLCVINKFFCQNRFPQEFRDSRIRK